MILSSKTRIENVMENLWALKVGRLYRNVHVNVTDQKIAYTFYTPIEVNAIYTRRAHKLRRRVDKARQTQLQVQKTPYSKNLR